MGFTGVFTGVFSQNRTRGSNNRQSGYRNRFLDRRAERCKDQRWERPLNRQPLDRAAALTAFDASRKAQNGKVPAQRTINNYNSALNRVLDEAELNGWIVKSLRPTLLNKGVKPQSRGSFSIEEYRTIYSD